MMMQILASINYNQMLKPYVLVFYNLFMPKLQSLLEYEA